MILQYQRRHGSYPESLEQVCESQGLDLHLVKYPNVFPLPENGRTRDEDCTLDWIYLPPEPGEEKVPLLIAPLPVINHDLPEDVRRVVVFQTHEVKLVPEKDMPAIWDAVFKRRGKNERKSNSP